MASRTRFEDSEFPRFPGLLPKRPFTFRCLEILEALDHAMYPATDKTAMEAAHRIAKLRPTCSDRRIARLPVRPYWIGDEDGGYEEDSGQHLVDQAEDEGIEVDNPVQGNNPVNRFTMWYMVQAETDEIRSYLYDIWRTIFNIAASADATDEIQERFLKVLQFLTLEKGYFPSGEFKKSWQWLPYLSEYMLGIWTSPTVTNYQFEPEDVKIYLNKSSFFARCAEADIMEMPFCGYGELVDGLEDKWEFEGDLDTPEHALHIFNFEATVLGVCRWMAHAPKYYYNWAARDCQETGGPDNSFYDGPARMCLQRWHFWISRLEDIAKNETRLSEEVRQSAMEAAQNMKKAEAEVKEKYGAESEVRP